MIKKIIDFFRGHLTQLGSWAAVVLSVVGILMASGNLGTGLPYVAAGWVVTLLTMLGVKPVVIPPITPTPTEADKTDHSATESH